MRPLALIFCLLFSPTLGRAGSPDDAIAAVKKTLDAAIAIARREGASRDENLASLRAVARDILDTQAMGRRAIGDVLPAQPPVQQQQFLELFDALIVRAYLQKLLLFRNPHFTYDGARPTNQGLVVATRIATSKDEYHVDYEMRERDGRWVATDVLVEYISLTDNYKSQFASFLQSRSFSELLDLMRAKVGTERPEPAS